MIKEKADTGRISAMGESETGKPAAVIDLMEKLKLNLERPQKKKILKKTLKIIENSRIGTSFLKKPLKYPILNQCLLRLPANLLIVMDGYLK